MLSCLYCANILQTREVEISGHRAQLDTGVYRAALIQGLLEIEVESPRVFIWPFFDKEVRATPQCTSKLFARTFTSDKENHNDRMARNGDPFFKTRKSARRKAGGNSRDRQRYRTSPSCNSKSSRRRDCYWRGHSLRNRPYWCD